MRRHFLASVAFLALAGSVLSSEQAQAKAWTFPWAPGPQGGWLHSGNSSNNGGDSENNDESTGGGGTESSGGGSGGSSGGNEQANDEGGSNGGGSEGGSNGGGGSGGSSGGNEQANDEGGSNGGGSEGGSNGGEPGEGGSDEGSGGGDGGGLIILTEDDHSFDTNFSISTDDIPTDDNPNNPPGRITVPEPSGLAVLAGAFLSYAGVRRRKRRAK